MLTNKKLKSAFRAVKADMDELDCNQDSLKNSVNDWVIFLDRENRQLKMRVKHLENRLSTTESIAEERKLKILREI